MDVGSELRRAREQKPLSLHDLAGRTKISVATLQAIERNEIARLPTGIFTRGFVKAYAHEVGLDPSDAAERYLTQFELPALEQPSSRDGDSRLPVDGKNAAIDPDPSQSIASRIVNLTFTILVLVLFTYFATGRLRRSPEAPRPQEQPALVVQERVPSATATSGSALEAPVAMSDTRTLHVDAHATGECWLTATADGSQVAYRLMKPDERQTLQAQNDLVLRIGNPASLDLSVDGRPVRRLGRTGEAVTVRITPQNYREFLSP